MAKDGHEVHFIARGEHLRSIRERGLRITSIDDDFTVAPASATDDPRTVGAVDWVLFAVKTYDTDAAIEQMAPLVGPHTSIFTFQNGVESTDKLGAAFGREHSVPAPIQIETFIRAPGHIEQRSPFRNIVVGELDGSITQRVQEFAGILKKHNVNVVISTEMPRPIWTKLLFLASLSGLTTCARLPAHDLFKVPEAREALHDAVLEVVQVAAACGVTLTAEDIERTENMSFNLQPGMTSSMHKDLLNGKRLEIDALNGAIIRLGHTKGIPTPVHQTIFACLKPHANGN